jgi:inner membrane protein
MLIGHLPGGYIAAFGIWRSAPTSVIVAVLIGSVLPDIDLLAFYFLDGRAFHHHQYITHRPLLWMLILGVGLAFSRPPISALGVGGLVHMALASIAGSIAWAWPISSVSYPLIIVPATHSHWILSFANHWTFKVEIVLWIIAIVLAVHANHSRNRT